MAPLAAVFDSALTFLKAKMDPGNAGIIRWEHFDAQAKVRVRVRVRARVTVRVRVRVRVRVKVSVRVRAQQCFLTLQGSSMAP